MARQVGRVDTLFLHETGDHYTATVLRDGDHVFRARLELKETGAGPRPGRFRIKRDSSEEPRDPDEFVELARLADRIHISEQTSRRGRRELREMLDGYQLSGTVVRTCRYCASKGRYSPLTENTAIEADDETICPDCARAELDRELSYHGGLSGAAVDRLEDLLMQTQDLERIKNLLKGQLDPDLTRFDTVSATTDEVDPVQMDSLNLHPGVQGLFEGQFDTLLPVQSLAVENGLLDGDDQLIVSATATGKTLIGELAGLDRALNGQGTLLFLVPLVALANQTYDDFQAEYGDVVDVTLRVGGSRISDDGVRFDPNADVIVGTYEGIDHALRTDRDLGDVGTVVIDEVHTLKEADRGHRLDGLISRLKYYCEERAARAKRGPRNERAARAKRGPRNERAAQAKRGPRNERAARAGSEATQEQGSDYDGVSASSAERSSADRSSGQGPREDDAGGGSSCERSEYDGAQWIYLSATVGNPGELGAKLGATVVEFEERPVPIERHVTFADAREKVRITDRLVKREFDRESSLGYRGQTIVFTNSRRRCHEISRKLEYDSAPYHAGLDYGRRKTVENRFGDGDLAAVVTTAALAAGVDFPASQVVFDSLAMGIEWLSVQEFHQMLGRAGRPDYHDRGVVYTLVEPDCTYHNSMEMTEDEVAFKLLKGEMESVETLYDEGAAVEETLANVTVGGKAAKALNDRMIGDVPTKHALGKLLEYEFIDGFEPTPLGRAVTEHFLAPDEAFVILDGIRRGTHPYDVVGDIELHGEDL